MEVIQEDVNESSDLISRSDESSIKDQRPDSSATSSASDFSNQKSQTIEEVFVKNHVKAAQVKKWDEDICDWKTSKRGDHQRLETVLEEGQLTSDEINSNSSEELGRRDSKKSLKESVENIGLLELKKPEVHNFMMVNNDSDEANENNLPKQQLGNEHLITNRKTPKKRRETLIQNGDLLRSSKKFDEGVNQKKQTKPVERNFAYLFQKEIVLLESGHRRGETRRPRIVKKRRWGFRQIALPGQKRRTRSLDRHKTFDFRPFLEKRWSQ